MRSGYGNPTSSVRIFKPFALLGENERNKITRSVVLPAKKSRARSLILLPKIRVSATFENKKEKFVITSAKIQNQIISKYQLKLRMNLVVNPD